MGDHKLAYEQITSLNLVIFNLKSALRIWKIRLTAKKAWKNLSISTNFGPKAKNFEIRLLYLTVDRFE